MGRTRDSSIVGSRLRTRLRVRLCLTLVFAGATISGCDVHGLSNPGTLARITVAANTTLLATSETQMIAVGYDADGRVITIAPTWSVVAFGGTINATGLFVAGATPGVFVNTVVALVGSISASGTITVMPGAAATIAVVPGSITLAVTTKQQFIAVAKDASGNIVQFVPTWSIVAGGGTIDSAGNFTAGGTPGTFTNTVQASNNGIKSFATVTVTVGPLATIAVAPSPDTLIVGAKQQFTVLGKDASGNVVPVAATWSIVANGGTIDQSGLFTAGTAPGTFTNTIQATSGTLTAVATVVVTAGPLATITVTPNPATMVVRATQQFTAVGRDAGGNIIAITPTWAVSTAANGASITPTGLYTAGTLAGTFVNKVRATSGSISGFATIVATVGALTTITVTPNPVSVQSNDTQKFIAVGSDASGNVYLITPLWSVGNGGGSIDMNTGVFTAGATTGTFTNTIRATSGAISGLATVMVTSPPVVGIISSFEDFSLGAIDGQQDWQSFGGFGAPPPVNPIDTHCAVYDHVIADNTAAAVAYSYPSFGAKSLRISNAVTSGCYTDQTFSNRTANPAGQAGAWSTSADGSDNFAVAGGVLQNHFEAAWSFASTVPDAEQPGLQVVVSPARGDDSRMSWVQMSDLPDGLAVIFGEWTSTLPSGTMATGAPQLTTVVQGLDRRVPHTIEITMDFRDGPNNDVVQLFVDGVLRHTGTSWENYYAYDNGRLKFGGAPPIVNRLMFRTGTDLGRGIPGPPAPATQGHGFVIDNLRQATFMTGSAAVALKRGGRRAIPATGKSAPGSARLP